ncbi:ATP-grasp domain-containing protein [Antribacter gilvus]|uniref:ATP-grasp domain-containing protein n=1 Tax=Antribacter gilvus TaxID=2304675 RepID=UPI000F770CD7|nr:ATP-grasp domain-containing protein [Antribacter gilvus]
MSSERGRIVVTGTGGASGYAVALQAEQYGYEVLWTDADPLCPALLMRPDRASVVPLAAEGRGYLNVLAEAAAAFGTTVVSLNTDAEVRYAASESEAIALAGLTVWTPDTSTVNICLDKFSFTERVARIGGFRTPRILDYGDVCRDFPSSGIFVKRRVGSGGTDAVLCLSRLELDAWMARNPDGLIQEVLVGQEFSADCLYTGSGSPMVVLRKRLRTRAGMSTVSETFHDDQLTNSVADLVQALDVRGPSCVQGFLEWDGVRFTEVNVRFGGGCAAATWGSSHLVEIYLSMLTTGDRRIPDGVPGRRPRSDIRLIRPLSYVVLALPTVLGSKGL